MSEMVERVARAIAWCHFDRKQFSGACPKAERTQWLVDQYWRNHVSDSRAAIEVMRESTEAMMEAGDDARAFLEGPHPFVINDSSYIWEAMIDAALK